MKTSLEEAIGHKVTTPYPHKYLLTRFVFCFKCFISFVIGCDDPDDYNCYDHIYSYNLPTTREILHDMYTYIKTVGGDDV